MKKIRQENPKKIVLRSDSVGLILCDFLIIHLSYFLALWLRFDCVFTAIKKEYLSAYAIFIVPCAILSIFLFWLMKMYQSLWRYASYMELIRTVIGSLGSSALHALLITLLVRKMPVSYHLIGTFFQLSLLLIPRFSYRLFHMLSAMQTKNDRTLGRIMIIGAGQAGQMILVSAAGSSGVIKDNMK